MDKVTLFRKRIIPSECIELKDDKILYMDEDMIITGWNTLKPKKDLHHGLSCYYLKQGYKISKFMAENGSLLYWYCDIIEHEYIPEKNTYIFTDLLADVVIYPDKSVRVIDLDEIGDALKDDLITKEQCIRLLSSLDTLLWHIYEGRLDDLTSPLAPYETP
ncbi:MAG: DUF402 domain-containing protein [Lachnospiraceae bacterium]|nr:DUF402 domain-containing protein [Lachnospiraceae bacterium]